MRQRFTQLLILGVLVAAVFGCTKDDTSPKPDNGDKVEAKIKAGVRTSTRAEDDHWDENDAIGLAMLVDENGVPTIYNDVYNYHYYTPAVDGRFMPASSDMTIYFPANGSNATFRSYYPYYARLGVNMMVPVDVSDQSALPDIDFMTAEHLSGFSKADPEVNLEFHHRLSKLIFNLSTADEEDFVDLANCEVTVTGMLTEGEYDLINERLITDGSSTAPIQISNRASPTERHGIVLPRAAGPGVRLEFRNLDGDYFSTDLSDTLNFVSGYKYTFNVTIKKTEIELTAEIEDWMDGPESNYQIYKPNVDIGQNIDINVGDVLNIYLGESGNFNPLAQYTYYPDDTWQTDTPVNWEDIPYDPATFRASIIAAEPLNATQMPDILIADELTVAKYKSPHFVLRHALSKVIVELRSGSFSSGDLAAAEIIMPNYLTGGSEQNGAFVPGTGRVDVEIDSSDLSNRMAIIQPQTIAAGDNVLQVTINGTVYDVPAPSGGETFTSGEAKRLIVTVDKAGVTLTAEVVDWTYVTEYLDAITPGTTVSGADGVLDGEEMYVYTGNSSARTLLGVWTYDEAADEWSIPEPVFWDGLGDSETFYASILRREKYNDTQLDDYLLATPTTVSASNGVSFTLTHAAAKVAVQLTSDDGSFRQQELDAMDIYLPAYLTGAYIQDGVFVPGTVRTDIEVEKGVGEADDSGIALIQPQTVNQGTTVVRLESPNGREYTADFGANLTFAANVATTLVIDMSKTGVTVNAVVVDWVEGDRVTLVPVAIKIGGTRGTTDSFFYDKTISVYKLNGGTTTYNYSYRVVDGAYTWTGSNIYWNDIASGQNLNLAAVYYPDIDYIKPVPSTATSFPWDIPAVQTSGYEMYDIMMAYESLSSPEYVNFTFTHPLSKVIVILDPSDEFEDGELDGATVLLNDFVVSGNAVLSTASMSSTAAGVTVTPWTEEDGVRYSALIYPQTKSVDDLVLTITIPGYDDPFEGYIDRALNFRPGEETVITVRLAKTAIELSATYRDWTDGDEGTVIIK